MEPDEPRAAHSATGTDTSTRASESTLAPAENLPDDARTLEARAGTRDTSPAALLRRVSDQLSDSLQNALAKVSRALGELAQAA